MPGLLVIHLATGTAPGRSHKAGTSQNKSQGDRAGQYPTMQRANGGSALPGDHRRQKQGCTRRGKGEHAVSSTRKRKCLQNVSDRAPPPTKQSNSMAGGSQVATTRVGESAPSLDVPGLCQQQGKRIRQARAAGGRDGRANSISGKRKRPSTPDAGMPVRKARTGSR
jgi:hypothetical protein